MRAAFLLTLSSSVLAAALELQAAGGTIQDQNVWLTYSSAHWGPHPGASLYGVDAAAANPLYRSGWWYRVDGVDTRENPFPAPDTETYSNGKLVATWNNVDGKGFFARETTWVFDDEGPSGGFVSQVFVDWGSNPAPHDILLFHLLDVDVAGSYTNDSAVLRSPGYLKITDGASVMRYRGSGAQLRYMVAPYDNTYGGDVKRRLNDTAVDNFTDGGLPFGPGDFTGGMQFRAYTPYGYGTVSVTSNQARDYIRGAGTPAAATPRLLFRSGNGEQYLAEWTMRRTSMVAYGSGYVHGAQAVTLNDFDGDADDDYLFRDSTTGALSISYLGTIAGTPLPAEWQVAATADFDGDGKADILWRNDATQKLMVWIMNGATKVAERTPNPSQAADANWQVVGADDFNNDGHPDLLFYNQTSGKLVLWHLDVNQVRISGGFTDPPSVGSNVWRAVAVGDFGRGAPGPNGPAPYGTPDILWQNDVSKKLVVWNMDFSGRRTSGGFTTPDNCADAAYPCYGDGHIFGPR